MVMSMMFMNMAATNTTLTLTLGLMCIRGKSFVFLGNGGATQRRHTVSTGRTPSFARGFLKDRRREIRSAATSCAYEAQPDLAAGIVAVGVDQDHALPGAE
jgi:hypothetical protein